MGEGLFLKCTCTNRLHFISNENVDYILTLLSKLDLKNEFSDFLKHDMDWMDCIELSWLLESNISENKIFELLVDGKKIPIILDDNINKPIQCQPLSLSKLACLEGLIKFLLKIKDGGIEVEL